MKRGTKVGIVTSGGDCQGLNAAIRGLGKALWQHIDNIEIYGMYDGYRGLIEGDYKFMQPEDFSGILTEGGTILGTSRQRYIPGKAIVDEDGNDLMPAMLETYNRLNLDCLVVMGGNGTQKSAKLLMDAGMNIVTLPKTIDNDIWGTDTTFGFQSAVDIATNVIDYIHSTASSHSRVFLIELMGRDEKVAEAIDYRRRTGRNYTIVAVAEGAVSDKDAVLSEEERRRAKESGKHSTISYRIASELESMTGKETRVTVPGHYQRGGPPCPYDRVLATRFGVAAAQLIKNKQYGQMVGIRNGAIVSVPLSDAASRTKFMSPDDPLIQVARDVGIFFGD